jgi:hypothetical protein
VSLFNGRDLSGWSGARELWSVEGGEIVGRTTGLAHNEFLRSQLELRDFKLSFEVKLVGDRGNSGVQFRSREFEGGEMQGPQADIGPGWWGKLYEENGRALLEARESTAVKPGEWNRYEIEARGSKVRTSLNGVVNFERDDAEFARSGILALQLHSGEATEVRFRAFALEVLDD